MVVVMVVLIVIIAVVIMECNSGSNFCSNSSTNIIKIKSSYCACSSSGIKSSGKIVIVEVLLLVTT